MQSEATYLAGAVKAGAKVGEELEHSSVWVALHRCGWEATL